MLRLSRRKLVARVKARMKKNFSGQRKIVEKSSSHLPAPALSVLAANVFQNCSVGILQSFSLRLTQELLEFLKHSELLIENEFAITTATSFHH